MRYLEWQDLPFGCAFVLDVAVGIASVDLTDCISMTEAFIKQQPEMELDTGDWSAGRFAWKLDNIRRIIKPIPVVGRQGLFNVEIDLHSQYLEAAA
ncbi:hypothetical protein LC593_34305 [Nostoc sp. CHAB 5844]|nr:hypothetical protein [Nostoc sp. CHAB 5844]